LETLNRTINHPLILGGSGFVGSALIRYLHREGVAMQALQNRGLLPDHFGIKVHQGGLESFEWARLEAAPPSVIFHVARMAGKNEKDRQKAAQRNAAANRRLLDWMERQADPPLLIFASGTLVYGSCGDASVKEDAPLRPTSFQRAYHQAEKPILEAQQAGTLPIIIVRPGWIYGPGSQWFDAFYERPLLRKRRIPVFDKGHNWLSLLHVADAAAMMWHLARHAPAGHVFNLWNGPALLQRDFAGRLAEKAGARLMNKSRRWLRLRYDAALAEAFTFSLKADTLYSEIWASYEARYPSVDQWLMERYP
jgi:nucleoside-diphosphate-sugar epimerase